MSENMKIWDALKTPPKDALKEIKGGRLKGFTDVNPQWRYEAMTKQFGSCGIGWKYEVEKLWTEEGSDSQVFAFAEIRLYIRDINEGDGRGSWSAPIPGVGGSKLVAQESSGLYSSDEAYKMAITDALSVALKMLGVAAEIYRGTWDASKHDKTSGTEEKKLGKKELQKKIFDVCMTIAGGDDEQAPGVLEELTHWEKDGEVKRQGFRKGQDLLKLSEPALKTIYGNAKKALSVWESARGPIQTPETVNADFSLEGGSEEAFALEVSIREVSEALGKKAGTITADLKKCGGDVLKLKAHHAQLEDELQSANGDK